jgi:LAO/AO transport system kinase
VGHRSREAVVACEAAGFDVIFVETVGVGQSETSVADMTDVFLLLLLPGGGDELQGMKKGIVELADIILVNKADGDLAKAAIHAAADYQNAIHMLRPASDDWAVPVRTCSALTGEGVADAWDLIGQWRELMQSNGAVGRKRRAQARTWMWDAVREGLMGRIRSDMSAREKMQNLENAVENGDLTPCQAATEIISGFRKDDAP